jgi:hypothetical protein
MVLLTGLNAIEVSENPGAGIGGGGCTIVTGMPAHAFRSIVCTRLACAWAAGVAASIDPSNTAIDPVNFVMIFFTCRCGLQAHAMRKIRPSNGAPQFASDC